MSFEAALRSFDVWLRAERNLAENTRRAYLAERDTFVDTDSSYPDPTMYAGTLGTLTMPWDADSENAFALLGWEPEGQVRYSYASWTGASPGATRPWSPGPCTRRA